MNTKVLMGLFLTFAFCSMQTASACDPVVSVGSSIAVVQSSAVFVPQVFATPVFVQPVFVGGRSVAIAGRGRGVAVAGGGGVAIAGRGRRGNVAISGGGGVAVSRGRGIAISR